MTTKKPSLDNDNDDDDNAARAVSKDQQEGGPHWTMTMSQGPTTTMTGTRPPQDKRPADDDKEAPTGQ